jgi:hypothetical protein
MLRLESQKLQLRQQAQPMTTADMERVESEISRVRDLTPPKPYRHRPPCRTSLL